MSVLAKARWVLAGMTVATTVMSARAIQLAATGGGVIGWILAVGAVVSCALFAGMLVRALRM